MNTLLAEDLMLVTADPARGTLRRPHGLALPRALAGAVLQDCLAQGAARLAGDRLIPEAPSVRPGPLVQHVRGRLTRETGVGPAIELLAAPRSRLGQHLLSSMTADGSVVRSRRRLLGVAPLSSYRIADPGAVETLRARVVAALFGPVDDPRVNALAALVRAADLHRLLHVDRDTVRRRGRPVLAYDPIAAAVADGIRRARRDAATSGAVAATVAGVAGSGS
ncbi:GOLPH3/VPS74 family protein [Modestobacter excelsi]|uniref:GOLPH3/VPS74 family protein n=1 Tax=Modestobacter excelsi TaxID=2213161 RepID=UPI001C20DCA7|nr:GPP34 family phosphoprotein [Modestobacter excelsi]